MNFEFKSTFKLFDKTSICFILTLAAAFTMKYFHTTSAASDLTFMLWPVSTFIEWVFNTRAVCLDSGYSFPDLAICVDKSCSGVNFLIISFCAFSSTAPYYAFNAVKCVLFFFASFVCAYILTLAVNTARIIGAISLLQARPSFPWVSHPAVHEAEGAFVYISALLIAYLVIKSLFIKLKNYYAKSAQSKVAVIH